MTRRKKTRITLRLVLEVAGATEAVEAMRDIMDIPRVVEVQLLDSSEAGEGES